MKVGAVRPKLLRSLGEETFNMLERHFAKLEEGGFKVRPGMKPGQLAMEVQRVSGTSAPEKPVPFEEILKDIETTVVPGLTQWQHPSFFAWYPAQTTEPAILADAIITALGAVGLQWEACPIGTELEVVVMEWLSQAMHITGEFTHASTKGGGMIQSTASDIVASVVVAARVWKHASMGVKGEERFYADSSKFVIYESSDTHFSGAKAARVAGVRVRVLKPVLLPDRGNYGITPQIVEAAILEDQAQGLVPMIVCLNYGSTNTCGYDDFSEGGFEALRERYNVWVHVDAAYAGASFMLPERQKDAELVQRAATSFNINGSKWLLCGFDSAFLWVRNRKALLDVYSATDNFMASSQDTIYSPEFKDWAIPLGRKFRSLRIWCVLRYFGLDGIRESLRQGIGEADYVRGELRDLAGSQGPESKFLFEEIVRTDLGLVCLKVSTPDGRNLSKAVAEVLTTLGHLVFPSVYDSEPFIRLAFGGVNTTIDHVKALWTDLLLAPHIALAVADLPPPYSIPSIIDAAPRPLSPCQEQYLLRYKAVHGSDP